MGHFSHISEAPVDPIFGLNAAFLQDPRKNKVNLGIGVYKTETLQTPILSCVKQAEKDLWEKGTSKSYLPVEGDILYLEHAVRLILGEELFKQHESSLAFLQTLGGTGALRLGGDLLFAEGLKKIYIPDPSWPNHKAVFSQAGLQIETYPYYEVKNKALSFEKMMERLSKIASKNCVLFHVNCHNPSGADFTLDQWEAVADRCKEKELIPFFDAAYLGFDQKVEDDAFPIRLFVQKKIEFLLAVSFSKNFSLYAERIGFFLSFLDPSAIKNVFSNCKILVRRNYSNPPIHGAKIVLKVLQTPFLKGMWEEELLQMRQRIFEMRNNLIAVLSLEGSKKDYSYLLEKKGLFSFFDLTKEQVDKLIREHGIYLTSDGRINLTGLNQENLEFVAKAMIAVGG